MKILDGITSLYNSIANKRNTTSNNMMFSLPMTDNELSEFYKSGIGNKIVKIKSSYALKTDALNFRNLDEREFYIDNIEPKFKEALQWAMVFGRAIIVINDNSDLSKPIGTVDKSSIKLDVFSGDMVSISDVDLDLLSPRYLKPKEFLVRGQSFHHSRVIDVIYLKVTEIDKPSFRYGGMSEFQLISDQIKNDAIIERASVSLLEKSSSLFYKIKGFKNLLRSKQEQDLVNYYRTSEDNRSIYGVGLMDADDSVEVVSQSLTNLKEVNEMALRRIALVSSIPMPMLIGENVKGLNSSGTQEKTMFNEMIELVQQDYVLSPLNELFKILGLKKIRFKENQNVTPLEKIQYETQAIDNALKLNDLGFDFNDYLQEKGLDIEVRDNFESEFGTDEV